MFARRARVVFRAAVVTAALACAALAGADDAVAAPGDHAWSARFGDANLQLSTGIATDSSGNVVLVGYFSGTINLGGTTLVASGGDNDVFVAKFDSDGDHVWSKRFGGPYREQSMALVLDSNDNIVIAGSNQTGTDFGGGLLSGPGAYILKLDASGNHVWSQGYPTDQFQGASAALAIDTTDNIIMTGSIGYPVDFGGGVLSPLGNWDAFVAKFDSSGTHLWSQRYGDADYQNAYNVAVAPGGDIVVAGSFSSTIDLGGGPLTTSMGPDIFVARFDGDGAHEWSKRFGGALIDGSSGVIVDTSGDILLAGGFQSTVDFGGGGLTSAGSYDIALAKFGGDGTHIWSRRYGGVDGEFAYGIGLDGSGNILMAGTYHDVADFGGGPLPHTSWDDVFVASFDGNGDHQWSNGFGEVDSDGDGFCTDGEETSPSHAGGGQRDPSSPYDFYDVDATGKIDAADIGLVRAHYNPSGPVPPEDEIYDRSPGDAPWAPGAPDNKINAMDIGLVRASFNDSCLALGYSQSPSGIAVDAAGSMYVAGLFRDSLNFGGGPLVSAGGVDAFIAKFDGAP